MIQTWTVLKTCASNFKNVGVDPLLLSRGIDYRILPLVFCRHCYRKTTSRLNELLLGHLRTNRERVILPSSRSKIKKKYSLH